MIEPPPWYKFYEKYLTSDEEAEVIEEESPSWYE
jgi:hypothetical protein